MARAPRSTRSRSLARTSFSSRGRMTAPAESIRSPTPTIMSRSTSGTGLRAVARLRRSLIRVPLVHWAPRPMRMASSWPSVVISPRRGPFRSISRFIATVVEYRTISTWGRISPSGWPSSAAPALSTLTKPTDRS